MKRTIFTAILIFIILFQFTSCENVRDIVHVRNTDTEIILFSQREVWLKLEILIEANDKEETIYIDEVSCSEDVTKINTNDLPGIDYFGEDVKIISVKYEIIHDSLFISVFLCILFVVLVIVFLLIILLAEPKNKNNSMDIINN